MTQQSDPLQQNRAFGGVIDVLEAIGAIYAIWGGLAVVAYGEPRFTMDMDVLVGHRGFAADLFVKRLRETHYHVDRASVQRAVLEGGSVNVIHLDSHIKSDFYVPRGECLLQQALEQRVYLPMDEIRDAAYVAVEDAIASKLRAYADSRSTRHLDDIASIIRVQGRTLDAATVDRMAGRLNALGVWRALWEQNAP
ncbi:MAG TPA: nucleotidyl transferase AbiEii/AbiGii toxin family protein [Candidatus Sulfomarinibacteraceae bacterium]|nr:nucleotidyl transferase AbiEii/AbiGii toxin family protein [Candidatus Sulfomarinibacteraceae bacterium]